MANTYTSIEDPRDWRGTPIVVGATVIYGAPVSRSIAMVEGTVESFTKSGRVNVRVVRRAYGYTWSDSKPVVHVGQDRLTVVTDLPTSLMPTEDEKSVIRERERAERARIHGTHDFVPEAVWDTQCASCEVTRRDSYTVACAG